MNKIIKLVIPIQLSTYLLDYFLILSTFDKYL